MQSVVVGSVYVPPFVMWVSDVDLWNCPFLLNHWVVSKDVGVCTEFLNRRQNDETGGGIVNEEQADLLGQCRFLQSGQGPL